MLDQLEREDRLGIVILGRPYHHGPGLNHGIPEEFRKLGYPVFSQSTLPLDEDLLERLFGDEVRAGVIRHPLDISDVWKTSFSASSNHKIWAAKFTARHSNLVALELSNFASSGKSVGDGERQRAVAVRNRRNFLQVESKDLC